MLIPETGDEVSVRAFTVSKGVELFTYEAYTNEQTDLTLTPEQARQVGTALLKAADAAEEYR